MTKKNDTTTVQATTSESTKSAASEADLLWEQIKKTPISLFGMAPNSLESLVTRVNIAPDKLHLSVKGPGASVSFIEDALNVRRDSMGSEVRVNGFEVESTNNGMLVISKASFK
jgi:hypothetical protein